MEPEKKQKKKSTGRKKKPVEEVRETRLSFRVSEKERQDLQEITSKLGLVTSDFIRSKVFGTKNLVVNGVNLIASLDKIGEDLGRAGNNINQLAKHANTVNKTGKVDESVIIRFNVLFSEYIDTKREVQVALRKIIREVRG